MSNETEIIRQRIQRGGYQVFFRDLPLSPLFTNLKISSRKRLYDAELYTEENRIFADGFLLQEVWNIEVPSQNANVVFALLSLRALNHDLPGGELRLVPRREEYPTVTFPNVQLDELLEWKTNERGEECFRLNFRALPDAAGNLFRTE